MDKVSDKNGHNFGQKIGQTFWKLLGGGRRGRYASCGHAGGLSCLQRCPWVFRSCSYFPQLIKINSHAGPSSFCPTEIVFSSPEMSPGKFPLPDNRILKDTTLSVILVAIEIYLFKYSFRKSTIAASGHKYRYESEPRMQKEDEELVKVSNQFINHKT